MTNEQIDQTVMLMLKTHYALKVWRPASWLSGVPIGLSAGTGNNWLLGLSLAFCITVHCMVEYLRRKNVQGAKTLMQHDLVRRVDGTWEYTYKMELYWQWDADRRR